MRRTPLALVIVAMALAACQPGTPTGTSPSAAASPAASPSAGTPASPATGMRTYSTAVKPITSGQGCRTCHAATQAGSSYEFDKSKAATIVRMAQSNGSRTGLSPQQIADIKAWFDAGSPNDPTAF